MFLSNVWSILTEPRNAWVQIRDNDWAIAELYTRVIIPLALISPIAGFIGTTQFGWQIGAGTPVKMSAASALPITFVYFGAILISVYVIGVLIYWMSETYGVKKPVNRCIALAAYSAVPLFLVGFFQFYPVLWINFLLGLPALAYAVYLLYSGVPVLMEISIERGFMFSSAILAVCLVALVGLLVSTVVLWSYGLGPAFVN